MESISRKPSSAYCTRFGTIAVELGYLDRKMLMQAIDEQVTDDLDGRPHRILGAICFDKGWMTPGEIDTVLNRMFSSKAKHEVFHLAAS